MNLNNINKSGLFIGLVLVFISSSLLICSPAAAVLRQHQESPGIMRYHVQTSLKDKQGMTWQVVLFPEYQFDLVSKYHLRLVGFPGTAEFIHPQPLEIITSKGQVLQATDLFTTSSPAVNVGEFDLTDLLPMLPKKGALKLSIALQGDRLLSLKIPESILIEWQLLANEV